MHSTIEQAKQLLHKEQLTCAVLGGEHTYTSTQRGIAPLMRWIAEGVDMQGYSAADKVVGKAAAYLYVLLGVAEVYALVISQPALEVLERYNIAVWYESLVPAIRNRTDTGFCPMETAVLEIEDTNEAYLVLKAKLEAMNRV